MKDTYFLRRMGEHVLYSGRGVIELYPADLYNLLRSTLEERYDFYGSYLVVESVRIPKRFSYVSSC